MGFEVADSHWRVVVQKKTAQGDNVQGSWIYYSQGILDRLLSMLDHGLVERGAEGAV